MLLETLDTPITVLNVKHYGVDISHLKTQLEEAYSEYEWDRYLLQQNKISLIQQAISSAELQAVPVRVWREIYLGSVQDSDLLKLFPTMSAVDVAKLSSLRPTRKRCVSEFELEWDGVWRMERVKSRPFTQTQALIAAEDGLDYRVSARRFKELPDELFDQQLRFLLIAVAENVKQSRPLLRNMNIVVHHTVVYCHPGQISTNSPEGIHQDGMDFIVSALVIERRNIVGGESVVYGRDKRTKILRIELQDGQGIFQADAGTDLWHEVTPIAAINLEEIGFRSTIGFDVTVGTDSATVC